MKMLVAVAALVPALALAEPPGLDHWSKNHPQASAELGEWVRAHPQAARLMFEWDGTHPERAKAFVTWTIAHPAQPIETFTATHPGWPYFDQLSGTHRPAMDAFMAWCRRHPNAAETLVRHPGGLRWAGNHLYAEYWSLEQPRR
jgi:hypothetical protein